MSLDNLSPYLPFLIPVALVQLTLMVTALVSVLRHRTFRFGNKVLWAILVVIIGIIGPVVYFAVGRGDE